MRSTRQTVPVLRPDLGPRPGEPVPSHPCRDQCAGPQHALVEEFDLLRTKAVDRVRIGRVVRGKSTRIGAFSLSCRAAADRTGLSNELDAAIGPAPGLVGSED